jgi:azurin
MNLRSLLSLVVAAPLLFSPSLASAWPAPAAQAAKAAADKPAPAPKAAAKATKAGAGRVIEITAADDMKFNVATITAKPGEQVTVRLKNIGKMPKIAMGHNFVLVKPTTKLTDFANAAMMAQATAYIPAEMKGEVLASTAVTGPDETVEITFKVPAKAGSYPFLCTFPGHFAAGMKGTLEVK